MPVPVWGFSNRNYTNDTRAAGGVLPEMCMHAFSECNVQRTTCSCLNLYNCQRGELGVGRKLKSQRYVKYFLSTAHCERDHRQTERNIIQTASASVVHYFTY